MLKIRLLIISNCIGTTSIPPAWEGLDRIKSGMGGIYNIHPSRMGNIKNAVDLIHNIDSFGADIMIGDDSLVGPACTIWQQIAIGANAVWVEAIEKLEDSDDFLACVDDKATYSDTNGYFNMCKVSPRC